MSAPGLLILAALVGSCVGSYSTTLALRMARDEQSVIGRSACDSCGVTLGYARTIPLISFVQSGGGCAACGARIDPVHLSGEILGVIVAIVAVATVPPWRSAIVALLGFTLLVAAIVDLKVQRLPHALTVVVATGGVVLSAAKGVTIFETALVSTAVTFSSLVFLRWALARLVGKPALGGGDVALLSALALWLGATTPWALIFACTGGLVVAMARGLGRGRIAFGPYIAAAAWPIGVYLELVR